MREVVETLLLAALIFFLVRLVVLNFRVDGESMLPNLDDGQMLLVNRNAYQYFDIGGNRYYPFDPPERGDVIVFDPPTRFGQALHQADHRVARRRGDLWRRQRLHRRRAAA